MLTMWFSKLLNVIVDDTYSCAARSRTLFSVFSILYMAQCMVRFFELSWYSVIHHDWERQTLKNRPNVNNNTSEILCKNNLWMICIWKCSTPLPSRVMFLASQNTLTMVKVRLTWTLTSFNNMDGVFFTHNVGKHLQSVTLSLRTQNFY